MVPGVLEEEPGLDQVEPVQLMALEGLVAVGQGLTVVLVGQGLVAVVLIRVKLVLVVPEVRAVAMVEFLVMETHAVAEEQEVRAALQPDPVVLALPGAMAV